jgi:hypothetical protein
MKTVSEPQQVVARYSVVKLFGWVAVVSVASAWILPEETSRGWRPVGPQGVWYEAGAFCSIALLAIAVALILNFVLGRGVAIARHNNEFVLYYPFSRKHVPVQPGLTITSTLHEAQVPNYAGSPIKLKPVFVEQVTLSRPGQADVNFRTGLLRERAAVIAMRMSAMTK